MGNSPRWTSEQYEEHLKKMGKDTRLGCDDAPEQSTPCSQEKPKMNKTEAEYLMILECRLRAGEIKAILPHESMKFRIGANRCWYHPDIPVIGNDGVLELHEVKGGHVYDDARVKFQSAIQQYPHFRWVWAQKKKGQWKIV